MERLTRLIDAIYDCALEDHDWSPTVVEIAEFCGGANAALVMTDPRIDLAHVLAPRADPTVIEDYNRFWWQHDPTVQATASIRPGVTTDLADTGREAFFASAFFNDYWSKSGLGAERVATNLFVADGAFGSIVLQASVENDEITEEARKRFDLVVPHLIRAMNTRRRLQGLAIDLQKERNRDHDGFMSIGQERRVLYADDGALAMLEDGCGMALWNRRLVLDDPLADTRLGQAIAACGGGG
ncbi:MAG: hypothetical protein KDJ77_03905, partial [Rhodobiaceae bacterium]|nr:hypothetical protein [Rhodobiaceae bacterium]